MRYFVTLFLSFMMISISVHAESFSLIETYYNALNYDAKLQAAKKDNIIQHQEAEKASSVFYPQARMLLFQGKSFTDSTTPQQTILGLPIGGGGFQHRNYDSKNFNLTIKQSLFNKAGFATFNQARETAYRSDAILTFEKLDFMGRIVASYLDILLAVDNIEYSDFQKINVEKQLDAAQKRFEAGVGTITEINEAKANLESITAKKLEWDNTLEYARRVLESYTGYYPDILFRLNPEKLPRTKPVPNNIETWINTASEKNAEIIAARHDIEIAAAGIDKSISGHYPTLDLIASKSYSESQSDYTIGSRYQTDSLGLQLEIPIYYGGYVRTDTNESMTKFEQSKDNLLQKEREVKSNVRKYFHEIINGLSRLNSYEASVKSNEIALTGTQKGFESGFRNNLDVLNAQEKLYLAKHDLSKERYTLIYNRILLKQVAGNLSEQDLQEISEWISSKN
jgi:protease secretion system outer membrane protein